MADNSTKDTRVVEMQFDASDFDKNIKKSTKNLEDFKKQLNFDDAVRQMNEGVSEQSGLIEKMAANVQKLTSELTGVGSLSSYVAQKIKGVWQGALNSVEGFAKSLTSVQENVGWDKYEKVTRNIQTIMNATGDSEAAVYSVMNDLMHYTDETSYSFQEMASSISKFTTAGVGLADAERELEGIANWAALSGQGINEANRAMYNISQAMSAGTMKLIDYKSIQNAQMDTRAFREEAIKAAVAVGSLTEKNGKYYSTLKKNKEVNVDNFTETLQFGWFNKATMESVFKTFGDNTQGIGQKAYKAAQRCVTFKDALDAIKDMLSTGWMKTYEHIFGKLSDAMALFSGMCNKAEEMLAKFMETRNGILEHWSTTGRDSLWGALVGEIESPDGEILFKGAYGLLDALKDVGDMVYDAFFDFTMMLWGNDNNYDLYKENPDKFYAMLGAGLTQLTQKVQNFTNGIKTFFSEVPAGQTMSRFEQIKQVVMAVFATVTLIAQGVRGLIQFFSEVVGQLQPAFDAIFGLFAKVASIITGNVVDMSKKNTIGNFFHTLAETLRPVTTILNVVVTSLTNVVSKVLDFLNATGMLQPAMIALVVGKIVGLLGRLQGKVGVLGLLGKIFGGRGGKIGQIVGAVSTLLGVFQKLTGINVTGGVIGWIQNLVGNPTEMVGKLKTFAKNARDTIRKSKIYTSVTDWVKTTFNGKNIGDIWQNVKNWFVNLGQNAPTLIANLRGNLGSIFGKVGNVLNQFFGDIIGFFVGSAKADEAAEAVNNAVTNILTPGAENSTSSAEAGKAGQSLVERLKASCDRLFAPVKTFFGSFFESIHGFFQSDAMKKVGEFFGGTTFMGLFTGIVKITKYASLFRGASGIVSMGKGIKSLGKGIKVFGKNMKDLNFSNLFSNMFNFSNAFSGNNSNNITKTGSTWANFGKNILMIAGAVGILTFAAIKLGEMKPDALKQAGIALGAMIGGLVVAGIAAKKWTGNGGALLKMAAAVTLMLYPLKKLMALEWGEWNGNGLLSGIIKLGAVVMAMAAAAKIAGNVKIKGLVGMAAAVNLLLHPIRVLSDMALLKYDDKGNYVGGLVQAIGALALVMTTMTAAARLSGGNKVKGLLSMAIALNLLLHPIRVLAGMQLDKLGQGVGALGILILSLGGLAYVTKDTKLASLAGVVTALAALSYMGSLIGGMELEKVLNGFIPIVALMGMMALVVHEAGKLQTEQIKALKTIFVAFAAVVAVMAGSMVALGLLNIPESTILSFFGGIIATLLMVGVAAKLARKTDAKTIGKLAVVLGLVSALVAVSAGGLILLGKSKVDWKVIAAFMGGITAMIAAIGIFAPILSKLNIKGILVAMGAVFGVIVAAGAAMALVIPLIMGSLGSSMLSMGARLKTISGLLKDFFDRMDTIGDGAVGHAIGIFDGLKSLILRFSGFASLSADINSVMSQLNNLGTGLDLFFVNDSKYPDPDSSKSFKILTKFIEIGPSLASFSVGNMPSQLLNLGVGLMLFNQATKDITSEDVPALGLLQGIFGQADNIEKFCKLPLTEFATQMSTLGGAMALYAAGASEVTGITGEDGIDEGAIGRAVSIMQAVVSAVSEDGALNNFTIPEMPEKGDLALFGGKLAALALALDEFISAADGMNENTQQAIAMLDFIGDLQTRLTTDRLEVFKVFGQAALDNTVLDQFALDIGALGTALSSFSELTSNTAFDNGLGALDHFQELNEKLTKDRLSFLSAFDDAGYHETALQTFADDIGALGHALASFAQNVTMDDGTQADFNYALRALTFMGNLQTRLSTELPKIGGLKTLWEGEAQTIGGMSDDIQEIGVALKDFSDAMSGIGEGSNVFNYDAAMNGLDTLEKLVDICNKLNTLNPDTGDVFGPGHHLAFLAQMMDGLMMASDEYLVGAETWNMGDTTSSIATRLATFAKGLTDSFNEIGGIDAGAIDIFRNLTAGLQNLMTIDPTVSFETPGGMIIDGLMSGMDQKKEGLMQSVVELMAQISTTMAENTDLMPTITPVLDLSNIASGAEQIGSYFGEMGLDLWSAMERAAGAVGSSGPTDVNVMNPTDLSGVQTSIGLLQNDIRNLGTAIGNIQIVLNTGVVAGGVTDDVDQNLGRKALYIRRRN